MGSPEQRYTPFVILALVAALVLTIGLWAAEKAGESRGTAEFTKVDSVSGAARYEWKMITTWPETRSFRQSFV